MSEHEENPRSEEHVEDLDVPEEQGDEVKGGLSLNFSKIEFKSVKIDSSSKISPGNLSQFGDGSV